LYCMEQHGFSNKKSELSRTGTVLLSNHDG
jgi:hypothetical protein